MSNKARINLLLKVDLHSTFCKKVCCGDINFRHKLLSLQHVAWDSADLNSYM